MLLTGLLCLRRLFGSGSTPYACIYRDLRHKIMGYVWRYNIVDHGICDVLYYTDYEVRAFFIIKYALRDVTYRDNYALRIASRSGWKKIVEYLLAQYPDVVDPSADSNDAIIGASLGGHVDIVSLLLGDARVDPGDFNNCALRYACYNGRSDVVALLLKDPRVDPSALENDCIRFVSELGYTDIVALLLADPRVDPSACDNYALRFACTKYHVEVVRLLLQDARVDPTVNNNEVIRIASCMGYLDLVRILLEDGRVDPRSAIPIAESRGYGTIVELLLDNYAGAESECKRQKK